jgi:hypothetical protein
MRFTFDDQIHSQVLTNTQVGCLVSHKGEERTPSTLRLHHQGSPSGFTLRLQPPRFTIRLHPQASTLRLQPSRFTTRLHLQASTLRRQPSRFTTRLQPSGVNHQGSPPGFNPQASTIKVHHQASLSGFNLTTSYLHLKPQLKTQHTPTTIMQSQCAPSQLPGSEMPIQILHSSLSFSLHNSQLQLHFRSLFSFASLSLLLF